MASLYDQFLNTQVDQIEKLWKHMESDLRLVAFNPGQSTILEKLESIRREADCDLHTAYRLIALEEQLAEQQRLIDKLFALVDRP